MAFSELSGAALTVLVPNIAEATTTSTNNTGANSRRLMDAPLTANNATLRCEQVYRAAQAHGITLGRKNPAARGWVITNDSNPRGILLPGPK